MHLWALDYAFNSEIKLKSSSKCCESQEEKLRKMIGVYCSSIKNLTSIAQNRGITSFDANEKKF